MSKNVKINGATYENVPKVSIPLAKGEGNADFYDTSSDTAGAGDILVGKTSHNADGLVTGSMPNNGAVTGSVGTKDKVHHSGGLSQRRRCSHHRCSRAGQADFRKYQSGCHRIRSERLQQRSRNQRWDSDRRRNH